MTKSAQPLPLSVYLITLNEARMIGDVLEAVLSLADEIIVVDCGSTDDTVKIAETCGARVIHQDWLGYGAQKRFAEDQCCNDWLLNLDGDEVLPPVLIHEIRALFQGGVPPCSLYQIKMTTIYPHHMRPRFWADAKNVIRLYDRRVARMADHPTWDAVSSPPAVTVGQLAAPAYHHSFASHRHALAKIRRYAAAQAIHQPLKPLWSLIPRLIFMPPVDFLKAYILRRHFIGGVYGFVHSGLYAYGRFLKHAGQLKRYFGSVHD